MTRRLVPFILAINFLLTIDGVNSASPPSCSDDCGPFIPGAVAYWPMTYKTKGSDMSGNGNHATFVNLTYTDGPNGEPNSAVHFPGNTNSYAWTTNSPSLEVGKFPGFSFCGFVRLSIDQNAPFIDYTTDSKYGLHVEAWPAQHIAMTVVYEKPTVKFPNMTFTTGSWRFFGVSYNKLTGSVIGFMDGKKEKKQFSKNLVAETVPTSKIGLGKRLGNKPIGVDYFYEGDMSCMMMLKIALTADDFERVWRFCRTESTQKELPNITVSDIAATTATAYWTKSPGTFSGYNITLERKQSALRQEAIEPRFIPSSVLFPIVALTNLIPNATYRVRVWHMQGEIKGGAISSSWFNTFLLLPVKPDSIIFSNITATSAEVTWDAVAGNPEGYSVDIRPTTGGAKAVPNTVSRGTTSTSLKNLSPGSYYTITIRTKISSSLSSPSTKSLQTPAATETNPPKPESPIAVIGLVGAGICLVVIIALIALIVILFRRTSSTSSGDAKSHPMSNLGFQSDDPSTSKTKNEGENDGYEVQDRRQFDGNFGSRQMPPATTGENVYENLNN